MLGNRCRGVFHANAGVGAKSLELLGDVLASFVEPQSLDAQSQWNSHRHTVGVESIASLRIRFEEKDFVHAGEVFSKLADVLVSSPGCWYDGSHQVYIGY